MFSNSSIIKWNFRNFLSRDLASAKGIHSRNRLGRKMQQNQPLMNIALIWTWMRIQLKSHNRLLCLLWLRCLVDLLILCDELGVFFQQDAIDCHYQVSFPHQKIVIALMHSVRIWNCSPKTSKSRLLEDIFVLITHLSYLSCLKTLSAVLEMNLHKFFKDN